MFTRKDIKKTILTIITSLSIGAVGGISTYIATANSNHFNISANSRRIEEIESNYVHSDRYESDIKAITSDLSELKQGDQKILDYIIRLR